MMTSPDTNLMNRKRRRSSEAVAGPDASPAFIIDTQPSEALAVLTETGQSTAALTTSESSSDESANGQTKQQKNKSRFHHRKSAGAVWQDDDDDSADEKAPEVKQSVDEKTRKNQRRRRQHGRIEFLAAFGPTPHYLDVEHRLKSEEANELDEDDEEEARAVQVLASRRAGGDLPPRRLDYERLADANKESPSHRRLTSVQFNPLARVLLTASTDQRFALFQVDPDRPVFDRLHSHHMPGFPVHCARFSPDGNHIVLSSVHRSFRLFDIGTERLIHVPRLLGVEKNCKLTDFEISPDQKYIAFIGKYGEVYLVDFKTRNRVCTLRSSSSSLQSLAFSPEGDYLLAGGSDGQVSVFCLSSRRIRCTFADHGSTGLASLAASSRHIACGSSSGIVNLYGWDAVDAANTSGPVSEPKPQRIAMNLTTECSCLRFHPSQELLLMASRQEPQAVRLWHLAEGGVMQNFPPPTVRHYLAAVHSADFSPGGGYMCLGQHTGRAAMFRLSHYDNY